MAKTAKKSKAKKGGISLNFKGVEGKRTLLPEDDYRVEVEEVELKDGDKAPYLSFTFKVTANADGTKSKHAGGLLWDNASTSEKSLWRLRSLLEALGVEVPDEELDIETDDLVGREMVAVVGHEKDADYGTRAKLVDFYAIDGEEAESGDEDEDKSSKKDKKKAGKKTKYTADAINEMDEDEMQEVIDATEVDCDLSDYKNEKKQRAALIEALTDAELIEDGDEENADEESEEDKKKRRRAERRAARKGGKDDDGDDEKTSSKKDKKSDKKAGKKYTADAVQDADEDELETIVKKSGVDVDLDDFKTLKKKQAAVIDALEDADLLESDD